MKSKKCPICGCLMKRNGKTSSGAQRWRCKTCGSSTSHHIDKKAKDLMTFVNWLLSKNAQTSMPGNGRTFRRKTSEFWKIWPMPEIVDEVHKVVFVDGIWIEKNTVILIACSNNCVLSWHLARSENTHAWRSLLSRIAPPKMVVTDGGSGFAKAVSIEWPETKVQRCLFHAFCQVKRCTTVHPKLQAGYEMYVLAKDLLHISNLRKADAWIQRFFEWCDVWDHFLDEKNYVDGRKQYVHERLRKARRSLAQLIRKETLFTYLDPMLAAGENLPATNNVIEGGVNAQIRSLLRNHRGMSTLRRVKAAFWWCYMHVEVPKSMSQTLREMPTDDDIEVLQNQYGIRAQEIGKELKWGDAIVWEELHFKTRYPDEVI